MVFSLEASKTSGFYLPSEEKEKEVKQENLVIQYEATE